MIVYLWDADGPASSAQGVTDDESQAREAAAAFIRSGRAHTARVEKAHFVSGLRALDSGYMRLGHEWTAQLHGDGRIRWVPFPGLAAIGGIVTNQASEVRQSASAPAVPRSHGPIMQFFKGLQIADPAG